MVVPTFRCNYYGLCKYCHVPDLGLPELYPGDFRWKKLVERLEEFPPCLLDITGGEPFMAKGFREFIQSLPGKHMVGVSTNLSFEISEVEELLPRFCWITASFHPFAADLNEFLEKVRRVRAINPRVKINMVAHPQVLPKLSFYVRTFEKNGLLTNVDPYLSLSPYAEEEEKLVRGLLISKRVTTPPFVEEPTLCNAGVRHFVVLPNGDVYTCWNGMNIRHFLARADGTDPREGPYYLGNMVGGTFKPRQGWIKCDFPCPPPCDSDFTERRSWSTHRG